MEQLREILSDATAQWTRRPPATEAAIHALTENCGFALPEEYLSFLRYSNGGEGRMVIEPWYFQLCSAEEVIAYNQDYNVPTYLPGWFAIGSDGNGFILAIRKRRESSCPVFTVPFIITAECDAVEIAYDFEMFAMALGRELGSEE